MVHSRQCKRKRKLGGGKYINGCQPKYPVGRQTRFSLRLTVQRGWPIFLCLQLTLAPPPTSLSLSLSVFVCMQACVFLCYQTIQVLSDIAKGMRVRGEYRPKISIFPKEQRTSSLSQNIRRSTGTSL